MPIFLTPGFVFAFHGMVYEVLAGSDCCSEAVKTVLTVSLWVGAGMDREELRQEHNRK